MTREEILKQMVDGKVFKDEAILYDFRLSENGMLEFSHSDKDSWNYFAGRPHWKRLRPVEEKKSYWLWVDPVSGVITNRYCDENGETPSGGYHADTPKLIKLEWSKVEF